MKCKIKEKETRMPNGIKFRIKENYIQRFCLFIAS